MLQIIPSSERPSVPTGTEIILHSSGKHGSFTDSERTSLIRKLVLDENSLSNHEVITGKACIYKWFDDEDGNHYIWVAMVHAVEGANPSPDSQLKVKWCPNDKKQTYRNRIHPNDTFDLKYTQSRGPTSKYFVLIDKRMCLAFNLELTTAGKFDHKSRQGSHAGSTSKEVAELVIREFYRQSSCEQLLKLLNFSRVRKAFA